MRTTTMLPLFAAGALLLAACAGDGADEATTQLEVTGTDALEFEPDAWTVPAGEEVTVEFTSEPSIDHDLVIDGAGDQGMAGDDGHGEHEDDDHAMDSGDLHVAHADPDESVTATFMIDEPGTYEVYCTVPGHRDAGMTAELSVVDDA